MKRLLKLAVLLFWIPAVAFGQPSQQYDNRLMPPEVTQDSELLPTGETNAVCVTNTPGPAPTISLCSTVDLTGKTVLFKLPEYTVATLPASHPLAIVTDGATSSSCTSGGGSNRVLCHWNGSAWASLGGGGSGGVSAADIQSNTLLSCVPGGVSDVMTCNLGSALAAYTNNMVIWLRMPVNNTGNASIDINTLGVRNILNYDGTTLADNTLVSGRTYPIIYHTTGTAFRLLQDLTGSAGSGITGTLATTGCLPKGLTSSTVDCSGIVQESASTYSIGNVSGNRYERTSQTPTGVRSQVYPDESGFFAFKKTLAIYNADTLIQDGTNCTDPDTEVIGGRRVRAFSCGDVASATFEGGIDWLPYDLATFFFHLVVADQDSAGHVFSVSVAAACRASGAVFDETFGTPATVSITMTTASVRYLGTSAAITPNSACPKGASLYWRATILNATTHTDGGNAHVIAAAIEHAS